METYSSSKLMAMAPERPVHHIEDSDEEEEEEHLIVDPPSPPTVSQQRIVIHRPIAVKVIRPIPKRATEEFYSQAHEEGLAAQDVHKAVMESHEWHRKWTQQEEEGHTHPHDNAREMSGALVPEHYAYQAAMDRAAGARNPSPEAEANDDAFDQRKRIHSLEFSEGRQSSLSSVSGDEDEPMGPVLEPPAVKRRMAQEVFPREPPKSVEHVNKSQKLVRPVALRIARPVAVAPPARYTGSIPTQIQRALHRSNSASSSISGLSPLSIAFQTEEVHEQVNVVEDDAEQEQVQVAIAHPSPVRLKDATVMAARDGILQALAIAGGDVHSDKFQSRLDVLASHFGVTGIDTRSSQSRVATEGLWLTLTKPTFFGNLGDNDQGDPMYTLGRMSFDMFSPTSLVCSLQGNFNSCERVSDEQRASILETVPKGLREEVEAGNSILRTYNIMTAFTIEPTLAAFPDAPNKDVRRPIRGIMTTYGYTLPDPENPNRHSVWITGGKIEANDDPVDQREWKRQFALHPSKHSLGEKAKLLAVKLLMGAELPQKMDEDGSMEFTFTRPLGGHGTAYVDTLYLDDTLRIVRGHRGTVFVFARMPEK